MPTLYAYSTKSYYHERIARGEKPWIKVGQTERDPDVRVSEQDSTSNPEELIFLRKADGSKAVWPTSVTDKAVHSKLRSYKIDQLRSTREWFACDVDDVEKAINDLELGVARTKRFPPRDEQKKAIKEALTYFNHCGQGARFLWNAKMRFGKTFASYHLMKALGAKKVLILTYKPATKQAWKNDLEEHVDFEGYEIKFAIDGERETQIDVSKDGTIVFASFQDILGAEADGSPKFKFVSVLATQWDLLVVDEVHFGTETVKAEELLSKLKFTYRLDLSGTPFKLLLNGEFAEDQVFNWTYIDEQLERQKEEATEWATETYRWLPPLSIYTYKMGSKAVQDSKDYRPDEFFTAAKFFGSNDGFRFNNQTAVENFLDDLCSPNDTRGNNIFQQLLIPTINEHGLAHYTKRNETLRHTFWYLPDVNSCKAMAATLQAHRFFKKFEIVCAAGDNNGEGEDTLALVERSIIRADDAALSGRGKHKGSITLSCGKLNTGVTVPEWTAVLMLNDTQSPQDYFQTIFRAQSPWPEGRKEACFVFDFNPNRALSHIYTYAQKLTHSTTTGAYEYLRVMLRTMNVLCYDDGALVTLDADDVLNAVSNGGLTHSLLARKFDTERLIDLSALYNLAPKDLEILNKIVQHRKVQEDITAVVNESQLANGKNEDVTRQRISAIEKETKASRETLKQKLRTLCTRLPHFMYLSEEREASIYDVITVIEPGLFESTTGITQEDFKRLIEVKLLDKVRLDDAVAHFRRAEEPWLDPLSQFRPTG